MKKHEKEKEFMKSLKAVSVTTSYCGTAGSESEESGDSENSEDELSEPDNYTSNLTDSSDDDESRQFLVMNPSPLYFLYDCEGTGGSVYKDHIVEIAAVLQPLPGNVETNIPSTFQSLINTSKRIAAPVVKKCGIKQTDLLNQPKLSEVLPRFISWIKNLTYEISTSTKRKYFPGTQSHTT
ncbi:unnamed protein product [Porites evermanni]|uniref:Exonuclease domain-containing protein n=1 Tax=Porites evermanni TaxID=104178 RepID=A0ABN8MKP8_9CNID|nr:unnamed protein product [Porites evermanni]